MTKEEFLSGMHFSYDSEVKKYFYQDGSIIEFDTHTCNIKKITATGFYWYSWVFNKRISGYIKFSELKCKNDGKDNKGEAAADDNKTAGVR